MKKSKIIKSTYFQVIIAIIFGVIFGHKGLICQLAKIKPILKFMGTIFQKCEGFHFTKCFTNALFGATYCDRF